MSFRWKFWHQRSICRIPTVTFWRFEYFSWFFSSDKLKSTISILRPTDLKSVKLFAPTMIISTKFEFDVTFRYLVRLRHFCCWNVIRLCDLYLWPFDIGQWSYMVGDVINPSTNFEDPITICSWVMSYDVHWQCVCSHCACTVPRDLYI